MPSARFVSYAFAAAQIAKDFELGKEKATTAATKVYETDLADGNYSHAAQIAKDFELGKEEKTSAAARAYETNLANGYYSHAAQIAKDFELGMDVVKGTEELARLKSLIRN